MRDTMILAGLLTCLATPLAAQGASPPGAAPDSAPNVPPVDKKQAMAAKLAGLVAFADTDCPDLRSDPAQLKVAVTRLGVDPQDLEQGKLALIARSYTETYRKDVAENCKRAVETFGPSSRIVPNLIVKR